MALYSILPNQHAYSYFAITGFWLESVQVHATGLMDLALAGPLINIHRLLIIHRHVKMPGQQFLVSAGPVLDVRTPLL